jgi:beta-N-acetylglucosaminidase
MESSSSASELDRSISVLDALIWTVETVIQVSPETVKSCFQKAKFMLGVNEDVEVNNSNNTENLQEALNHANFGNIRAEYYVYIDMDVATEADLNDINQFFEDHRQQRNKIRS